MDFPHFSLASRATSACRRPFPRPLPLLLSGALLLAAPCAEAQQASGPAPIAPAPAPLPTAPNIGILLLAIDELPAPGGIEALPPAPMLPAPALPGAIAPAPENGAVVPANPDGAAITPARALPPVQPFWWGLGQKKKKASKDDELFRLEPDFGHAGQPRPIAPAPPVVAPVPDAIPLPIPQFQPPVALGRSHAVAIPLRRALLSLGWAEVSLSVPGAAQMSDAASERRLNDALNERRLSPRAFQALKSAFADLTAPGAALSPAATARATLAASRIGQALGYRAVAALYVAPSTFQDATPAAAFSILLADSARESGEPILFDEKGQNDLALREAGAITAAALLDKTLRAWPETSTQERLDFAAKHLANAKIRIAAGDVAGAQDELNQTIALDPTQSAPLVLLGDLLAPSDPQGAAGAYRRAVELDARDGATLAKIAIAYTNGTFPDWPRALDAGRRAILAGFDSVPLRVALASAQYGRADLFRKADRIDKAEDAESDARINLDRALELAPDDPSAVRLLARRLVEGRRFNEASQTLDRIAPRYPTDLEIQSQYAAALAGQAGREEDAFVAAGRVWKLSGVGRVDVDASKYRALAQGFDARLFNIGRSAVQLTTGVANAALPREDALLQLTKLKEDMSAAEVAIGVVRSSAISAEGLAARQFAATLMTQALEQQQLYLETGQSLARLRGQQLYTQAVSQLNAARGAR